MFLFFAITIVGGLSSKEIASAEEVSSYNEIPELVIDGKEIVGELIDEGDDYYTVSYYIPADDIGVDDIKARAWPGYSLRNIKAGTTTTNYNYLVSDDVIAKGGNKKMTVKWSRTTEISGSAAIGAVDLNSKIGFKASATVSLSKEYSYTCPKDVKSCTIKYYPRITKYTFDEYFLEVKTGSKSGTVLTGFHQVVTFNK